MNRWGTTGKAQLPKRRRRRPNTEPVESETLVEPEVDPTRVPLSVHERAMLANAVVAVRSGDPAKAQAAFDALLQWHIPRLFLTLQTAGQRYMSVLTTQGRVDMSSVDGAETLLADIARALPPAVRPTQEHLFFALTTVTADEAVSVAEQVQSDVPGACFSLLLFISGLAGLGGSALPSVASLVAYASFPAGH